MAAKAKDVPFFNAEIKKFEKLDWQEKSGIVKCSRITKVTLAERIQSRCPDAADRDY